MRRDGEPVRNPAEPSGPAAHTRLHRPVPVPPSPAASHSVPILFEDAT